MKLFLKNLLRIPFVYALTFWLVVVVVGVLIVDWVAMPIIAGRWKSTVEVPSLVGVSSSEAELALDKLGLKFVWSPEGRYSSQVPAGHVLVQIPAAGRTVKNGRTVLLTVSKGQREVTLPDLRGKSQRQAEISLNRLGLVQGKIIEGAHATIPRGVVIRTEPSAGKLVRMGKKVDIVLSAGKSKGKIILPSFVELSMEQAFQKIDSLGFTLGKVVRLTETGKLPNTVLEQKPRSGEYLAPGTQVDLTIAD